MRATVDFSGLEHLRDKVAQLEETQLQVFFQKVAKELAARLLRQVIPATPVGKYSKDSGKVGGTLRRGWTAETESEAASGSVKDAVTYAASLPVEVVGDNYVITIINPVHYASYVEYGHRQKVGRFVPAIGKRLKNDFVEGKFMLTKAEVKVEGNAQKVIEKHLMKILGETFT